MNTSLRRKKSPRRRAKDRGYGLEYRTAKKLGGYRNLLSKRGDVHARGYVGQCKHQSSDYGLTKLTKWIEEAKHDAKEYGDGKWFLAIHLGGRETYVLTSMDDFEERTREAEESE